MLTAAEERDGEGVSDCDDVDVEGTSSTWLMMRHLSPTRKPWG